MKTDKRVSPPNSTPSNCHKHFPSTGEFFQCIFKNCLPMKEWRRNSQKIKMPQTLCACVCFLCAFLFLSVFNFVWRIVFCAYFWLNGFVCVLCVFVYSCFFLCERVSICLCVNKCLLFCVYLSLFGVYMGLCEWLWGFVCVCKLVCLCFLCMCLVLCTLNLWWSVRFYLYNYLCVCEFVALFACIRFFLYVRLCFLLCMLFAYQFLFCLSFRRCKNKCVSVS